MPIVPLGKDDVANVVLNPIDTEMITGWNAKVSFTDTIYNQLKWYDAHGGTDIFSHLASSNKYNFNYTRVNN